MIRRLSLPLVGLAVFFGIWEAWVRISGAKKYIIFPPSTIAQEVWHRHGAYLAASLLTGRRALVSLAIAFFVAAAIGAALAGSRALERASEPVLLLIQVTPFVAYLGPLVVWLSFGEPPLLFAVSLVCMPTFTFAIVAGLRSADPHALEVLRSVDASSWETWRHLRLPSAMPSLFTAARYNLGLALIVTYIAEGGTLLTRGLGVIGKASGAGGTTLGVWAAVYCMAVLGAVGLASIAGLERWLLSWHASQRTTRR